MALQPIQFLLNTIADEALLPSFFELYVFDEIDGSIKPAVKHVLRSLADSERISNLSGVSNTLSRLRVSVINALEANFDVVYSLLLLVLNYHSIMKHDATIVEVFGGYKRVNIKEKENKLELEMINKRQKYISIAISVLIPAFIEYLKRIQVAYQHEDTSNSEQPPSSTFFDYCKSFINKIPRRLGQLTCAVYDTSILVQKMLYLMNQSKHSHPLLLLAGVSLIKKSADKTTHDRGGGGGGIGSSLMKDYRVITFIGVLLSIRVTRWLLNNDGSTSNPSEYIRKALQKIPKFPPPSRTSNVAEPGTCPLCARVRVKSTASVGGYVFCHDCILEYVRVNKRCPISGLPCVEDDLIVIIE